MAQQQHQLDALKEARIQFALQAMKQDATISQRRAAALYKVSHTTLSDRRAESLHEQTIRLNQGIWTRIRRR
jgi:hypothetical protein